MTNFQLSKIISCFDGIHNALRNLAEEVDSLDDTTAISLVDSLEMATCKNLLRLRRYLQIPYTFGRENQ